MSDSCLFCRLRDQFSDAGEIVYLDQFCAVVLHDDWATRGHAMIVWKRHVENFSDLDESERQHFATIHARVERALLAATGTDRAILLKLGIQTPHLHLHVYPVGSTASREAVMAAIDGKTRVPREETLVSEIRRRLTASSS